MPSQKTVDAWLDALEEKAKADDDLSDLLDDFYGYEGADFLEEAQMVLSLIQTGKTYWSADQATAPISSLAGREYGLEADWSLDGSDLYGVTIGRAIPTGVGVLYVGVYGELKHITEDREATGFDAVKGYARALAYHIERLEWCISAAGIQERR